MPRKSSSNLQAHLVLQPSAPLLPTSSAAEGNLLLVHGASQAASEARPPSSCGSSSPEGIAADVVSIAPILSAQAGPQAAPVATVWPHQRFPKVLPSDQGSGAPGGQTKQGPRPRITVKEPESVLEDSERNADNQLLSAEKKSEMGPSKMPTTKRSLAVPHGDVCRFRNKLYPVLELPNYTTVNLLDNSDDNFEGPSRTTLPVETGNVVKMLADSTSCSPRSKQRCGAGIRPHSSTKDDHVPIQYTCAQKGAKVPDWKESSSPLEEEEFLPRDIDCDSSLPETRATSFLASDANEWVPGGLAQEYLLTPLNTLKKYSSQNFNLQVENYFKRP